MKLIKNKITSEMTQAEFNALASKYTCIEIDLGTGDGKFIYKSARANPQTLNIGIEPTPKQFEKTLKKMRKNKVENILLVLASLETLPQELTGLADKLSVILPWGTLLQAIVKPTTSTVTKLAGLLRDNGVFEIVFGFLNELEPTETGRLGLHDIEQVNLEYIKTNIVPVFERCDFKLQNLSQLTTSDVKSLGTTWGKKLGSNSSRPFFSLRFVLTLN